MTTSSWMRANARAARGRARRAAALEQRLLRVAAREVAGEDRRGVPERFEPRRSRSSDVDGGTAAPDVVVVHPVVVDEQIDLEELDRDHRAVDGVEERAASAVASGRRRPRTPATTSAARMRLPPRRARPCNASAAAPTSALTWLAAATFGCEPDASARRHGVAHATPAAPRSDVLGGGGRRGAHVLRSMDSIVRLCQCRRVERSAARPTGSRDELPTAARAARSRARKVRVGGLLLGATGAGVNRPLFYFHVRIPHAFSFL